MSRKFLEDTSCISNQFYHTYISGISCVLCYFHSTCLFVFPPTQTVFYALFSPRKFLENTSCFPYHFYRIYFLQNKLWIMPLASHVLAFVLFCCCCCFVIFVVAVVWWGFFFGGVGPTYTVFYSFFHHASFLKTQAMFDSIFTIHVSTETSSCSYRLQLNDAIRVLFIQPIFPSSFASSCTLKQHNRRINKSMNTVTILYVHDEWLRKMMVGFDYHVRLRTKKTMKKQAIQLGLQLFTTMTHAYSNVKRKPF